MDDQEKQLLEEIHSAVADDDSEDVTQRSVTVQFPVDDSFVKAIDQLKTTTSEKLDQVVEAVKKVEAKELPTSVKVSNLHDIEPSPEEVRVTNLKDISFPKPPSEVEIKQPKWWKSVDLSSISTTLKRLLEVVTKLEVPTDDPTKPIAVRLSDGESFYKALEYVLQNSGGSGGSALTWQDSSQSPTRATTVKVSGLQYAAVVNPDGTNVGAATNPTTINVPISVSAGGVTNLVAAQAGKAINVLQVVLLANGAVNVKFQSHTTPTDLTGLFYLVANTGFSSGYSPVGQFKTVVGEALDINLSGGVAVGGYLVYTLV